MNCKNEPVSIPSNESVNSTTSSTSSSPTPQQDLANSRFLPESFEPTDNEVILGRGKQIASHKGNKLYKEIVLSHIKEYSAAQTKALKSSILSHIVNKIRANSAFQAGFIKQDGTTGRWMIAEDSAARIATAQIFRDALHDNYKSSKHFKQQRRQDRKGTAKKHKELRVAKDHSLLQQQRDMLQQTFPPALVTTRIQQSSGVQDQIAVQLNSVLEQLKGGSSLSSMLSAPLQIAFPPTKAEDTNKEGDVVSVLFDHFGAKVEPESSNPFEPTPIAEDALIFSTNSGFKLRQPFSG